MQFAAPALLGLLPLALAPIVVHLLYKRRRATIDFPWLRLLRNVELRLSPRRKLREILLLVARCLFVAMLVLAVARPVSSGSTGSSSTAVDHVLLIDNTASMKLANGASSAFVIAKRRAGETIDALGSRDRAALVPLVEPDGWEAGALTNDRTRLRLALDGLIASDAGADVVQALEDALRITGTSSAPRREILVFSDFRGPMGLVEPGLMRLLAGRSARTGVLLVDCATPSTRPNVALELVDVDPPAPLAGRPVEIVVRLTNASPDELVRGVGLELAGVPLETRNVTVPGAGSTVVRLRVPQISQVGWTYGRVMLSDDGFDVDNAVRFVLRVRDRLRVLVVDPALADTVPDPEASGRFLTRMLDPTGDGQASGIEALRVRPAEVSGGRLPEGVHAVLLCGYGTAQRVGASALGRFADEGGFVGVFPEATDRAGTMEAAWLPALPRGVVDRVDPPGSVRWAREGEDTQRASFQDLAVRNRLEMVARDASDVVLVFGDGGPALVVESAGDGHALAVGFGLGPFWGGFTFHPQIVALFHRLVARYASPPAIVRATAGVEVRVPSGDAGPASVTLDGETLGESTPVVQGVEGAYDLGRVLRAGIYAFDAETEGDFQRFVAVNADVGESALSHPEPDVLATRWGGPRVVGSHEQLAPVLGERRAGSEYTAFFLLLALAFALAEAILGNRRPRRRAAPSDEPTEAPGAKRATTRRRRRRAAAAGKGSP